MDTVGIGKEYRFSFEPDRGVPYEFDGQICKVTKIDDSDCLQVSFDGDIWWCSADNLHPIEVSVRNTQIGGAHYHEMKIQPYEYSLANNLGPLEHTAIKYVSRWRKKNGVEDLKKAIHTIQYLIEYTEKNGTPE